MISKTGCCARVRPSLVRAAMAMVLALAAQPALAQCPPADWLPGHGYNGADGAVLAMTMWDPDGDGPMTPKVIVGGSFKYMCDIVANNVAMYDPETGQWSPMGGGLTADVGGAVRGFAVQPNGRLIAVGKFDWTGDSGAAGVARWTGTGWISLGGGVQLNGEIADVSAVVCLPNSDIIVGGHFNTAGSVPAIGIARFDGDTWSAVGAGVDGVTNARVLAMDKATNGDLIVGGDFTTMNGVAARNIARWDGSVWQAMGNGFVHRVTTMQALPDGSVAAADNHFTPISRWNGSTWSPLGTQEAASLSLDIAGNLLCCTYGGIRRWDGSTWTVIAGPDFQGEYVIKAMQMPSGDFIVGGTFYSMGGVGARSIAIQKNGVWSATCPGINHYVTSLDTLPNGDVVAAGRFSQIGGVNADRMARWDGNTWHSMGPDVYQGDEGADKTIAMPNGDVVATGYPFIVDGVRSRHLGRWDGSTWTPLGGARGAGPISALPNGGVVGANISAPGIPGSGLKRWDGQAWHQIHFPLLPIEPNWPVSTSIQAVLGLPNGDIMVGGDFINSAQMKGVARWDGTSWQPMGSGVGVAPYSTEHGVNVLLQLRDRVRIVAGGGLSIGNTSCVAMWNGETWLPMGGGLWGQVLDLCELTNGDIIATGRYLRIPNVPNYSGIARWNGTQWLPVGNGFQTSSDSSGGYALAACHNGDFLLGGEFTIADDHVSVNLARHGIAYCPADLDNGTSTGTRDCAVTIDDLLFFLVGFEAGVSSADLDNGTGTGSRDNAVTIDDLLYFLVHFEQGC